MRADKYKITNLRQHLLVTCYYRDNIAMMRIFNKKKEIEILIDDAIPEVTFTPKDYEDNPSVIIELKNFDFHRHTFKCKECDTFSKAFGTDTLDWFIGYLGKVKRLDLRNFGNNYTSNNSIFKISEFYNGSILKLNISHIPDTLLGLQTLLENDIANENYEKCCVWRDLINELDQ